MDFDIVVSQARYEELITAECKLHQLLNAFENFNDGYIQECIKIIMINDTKEEQEIKEALNND